MKDQVIKFEALNQSLRKTSGFSTYPSDMVEIITAEFELGDEWDGYDSVRAVWQNGEVKISSFLDSNHKCKIPSEVLENKGTLEVNLVASSVDDDVLTERLTSYKVVAFQIPVKVNIDGSDPQDVTPSQFEQFVAVVKEDADRAEAGATDAEASAQSASGSATASANSATASATSAGESEQSKTQAQEYAQNAYNSAVGAESAKDDAEDARDEIRSMRAEAVTLSPGSDATASYSDGLLSLGIPRGDKGDTGATGAQGERGPQGIQGETGPQGLQGAQGDDYVLTEQDKQDIADIAEADLTPTILNAFPTDIASGGIASFSDGADNLPLKSLVVNINPVQDLHGQESPYPAGGGKNLFNGTFLQGYWAYANGAWISVTEWIATEKIPCKPSTYYTASADNRQTRWQGFVYYDNNGDYISSKNLNNKVPIGYTAQTPANAAYLIFNIAGESETTNPISPSDVTHFQLEEGQTATSYAPYENICPISGWAGMTVNTNGTEIPISWQSEAGTVYGGTLDVTTGKLTVDRAMVDLGAKNWYPSTAAGRTRFRTSITDIERISSPNVRASLLCSNYPTKTANQTYQGATGVSLQQNEADIYIYDPQTESMTGGEFKSAMSGVQLVYKLATPQTYQLTPTEVTTLLGDNTIWTDTGDTEVVYRADTKLYIDKKFTELQALILEN